jgi:predicted phage terminase large subunit-like protein
VRLSEAELAAATPEELAIYARHLELTAQLSSPLDYAETVSKADRYAHVELLNLWLLALVDGRLYFDGPGPSPAGGVHPTRGDRPVYNVAVSMPPRHGKSYLVSEHFPAWFLTMFPQYSLLLASYEANFASEWGAKVRDHLVDHPEFGVSVVNGRAASKSLFNLEENRGFMKCAGAGGPLTGSGGQMIVVDDPIKNAEQALSAIERENLDNWWHSTLYTRREPWDDGTPGRVILMATRWHEDDLTGRRVPTKPAEGDEWALLNLQAIFEPTADWPEDPLGRAEGAALCPERFDEAELESVRKSNVQWFQAMYQGEPSLDDGNLIHRPFNYYTLVDGMYTTINENGEQLHFPMSDCYRFATLDPAGTDKSYSDYTVMTVFDVTNEFPRRLFLHAVEQVKMDQAEHEQRVIGWYEQYNLRALHVEDKTFGKNIISRLVGRPGMIVQKLKADANKVWRALPIDYEIRSGLLWFPENADWLPAFERELTKFPKATHDDQVDALAYGVQVFKALPAYFQKNREPVTMEEIMSDHIQKLAKKKKPGRQRLPGIGRW